MKMYIVVPQTKRGNWFQISFLVKNVNNENIEHRAICKFRSMHTLSTWFSVW